MLNSKPEKSYHFILLTSFLQLSLFFIIANVMSKKKKMSMSHYWLICISLNFSEDECLFRWVFLSHLIFFYELVEPVCLYHSCFLPLPPHMYILLVDSSRSKYVTGAGQ